MVPAQPFESASAPTEGGQPHSLRGTAGGGGGGSRQRAITLIQRFGSAANLNIHLHCLVLYGVCLETTKVMISAAAKPPSRGKAA
jgi:hypothetical protein